MRALFAMEGVDFKHHSAVVAHFRKNYIKEGVFDSKYSDYVGDAFNTRARSDYEDFYLISKQEVEQQLKNAEELYAVVAKYLKEV